MDNGAMREDVRLADLLPVIREVTEAGGTFPLYPRGSSMLPTIVPERDMVVLAAPERIQKGDIILYQRESGIFVLHRVVKKGKDGSFVLRGDNQLYNESGVLPSQIIAMVTLYYKKGKPIRPRSLREGFPVFLLNARYTLHRIGKGVLRRIKRIFGGKK